MAFASRVCRLWSASPRTRRIWDSRFKGECATNGKHRTFLHWFLPLAILVISCDVSSLIGLQQPPTPVPGAVNTIVVQTAQAAASQTAAAVPPTLTPTFTPIPTKTPSETPSPTPTFLFFLPTLTRTPTAAPSASDFACNLTDQSPPDGSSMSKNETFIATWTVRNTGQATWSSNNVDFVYVQGAKLATVKAADLPKSVSPGGSVKLSLSMVAPNAANTYKTVWTLQQGKNSFCRLTLSIVVK